MTTNISVELKEAFESVLKLITERKSAGTIALSPEMITLGNMRCEGATFLALGLCFLIQQNPNHKSARQEARVYRTMHDGKCKSCTLPAEIQAAIKQIAHPEEITLV